MTMMTTATVAKYSPDARKGARAWTAAIDPAGGARRRRWYRAADGGQSEGSSSGTRRCPRPDERVPVYDS